ncbi:MAG: hypothetical protein AAE983_06725 [Thermoplasmataceae archaeon]|jgi:fatty acid desaturase|nr:hypothetical protein [Candidatus Thermoplasmatota archaeon]
MTESRESLENAYGFRKYFWGRVMGLGLLIVGVGFYFVWSVLYGTWTDVGLYSFVVVVVIFGFLELALVQSKIKDEIREIERSKRA